MALQAEGLRAELIEKILDQVRENLEGDTASVERFIRLYYEGVAADLLLEMAPDNLFGAALSLWSYAGRRKPGVLKIRVYNPNYEEHGWTSTHTVVEVVNDDMPFLVDSVVAALNQQELTVHLLIHPVMRFLRDDEGALTDVLDPGADGGDAESVLHVEISQRSAPESLEAIRRRLASVLGDVLGAVEDWEQMRAGIDAIIDELGSDPPALADAELAEGRAFLEWIRGDNFTFLGMRDYQLVQRDREDFLEVVPESGLGVLREVTAESAERHRKPLSPVMSEFARRNELLIITKASSRATVHRPVYMDYVGVRRFDADGNVSGERRFVGLLTSSAYNRNPRAIPLLRRKVQGVMDLTGFESGGHNAKAMLNILETYPRDELFQIREAELLKIAYGILHLEERQRIRLFIRRDSYARFFSCLVYVPRDRYTTELRQRFEDILRAAFEGGAIEFTTHMTDAPMARVHFIVHSPGVELGDVDVGQIEERLVMASRMWADELQDTLVEREGEARGYDLYHRYRNAFPAAYRDSFPAQTAVSDIERIERVLAGDHIAMNLYRRIGAAEGILHFKMFHGGQPVPLSDILPMLENMGLRVVTEMPFAVTPADLEQTVYIHDFQMHTGAGEIELTAVRANFQEAFARIWDGDMEDDGLNRLIIRAGLTWREVVIIRAYTKFLRQARITFSQLYIEQTLAKNASIPRLLVDLFQTRFDPNVHDEADQKVTVLVEEILAALDDVANLEEDRILRRYLNLILSTLRTNYYVVDERGASKPYLSIKLDSQQIDELPLPRPLTEIFVYSPRVEGVHLRGGKVARGGIRWSDRREDFRTEILGLMKAQMVKNGLIVPVGAKGGFVVKRPPMDGGREALMGEVVECYRTLIRGMLDITDNLAGDRIVMPAHVVRLDDDDPYLVVAADKGTATFSDIANAVAREYGFWLDDAFASGGSSGYDHKKMGITARGAWESVKRHFRELGLDVQSEDFTVIGVGDMSGDVFGNGMLLSEHIKLVGAFNHLHIFLDPDPDPKKSYQERQRLFGLPRSSWADYEASLISKGGGVFDRTLKSIEISPEIKKLLAIKADSLTPNELIRSIMRGRADLLWFGGIGTYVKAGDETQLEVGDRASDALRVDARDLRCRVIGEGANLGVTQRGRIEYAMSGGRINTDAIDNSGGVDCSDHEVNIKVLLGDIVANGDMTTKQRDQLLERMTDDVAELVLRSNYQQSQALTVMATRGASLMDRQQRMMRDFERTSRLDREIEDLPDDEALAERRADGTGLTRPELAVLLAYAKISLYDELLASNLPDDPLLFEELARYFPQPLGKSHRKALQRHRLRREIIATFVTNSMVNRVGATFVNEMAYRTGVSGSDVARVYAITRDTYDLRSLWSDIESLDNKVPAALQTEMLWETNRLVERSTQWFLRNGTHPLDVAATSANYGPGISELMACLGDLISREDKVRTQARAKKLAQQGVPKALALRIADLNVLALASDIVRISRASNLSVEMIGRIYFSVGSRFGLDWLRTKATSLVPETDWQKMAIAAIVDDVFGHQSELTVRVVDAVDGECRVDGVIDEWVSGRQAVVARTGALLTDLRAAGAVDIAMLAVANRQFRSLVSS